MSVLHIAAMKPMTPIGGVVPPNRKQSMTYVISPEQKVAYDVATRALNGSVADATLLRAPGVSEGFVVPGWLGRTNPLVRPGDPYGS
jgi:hypothetical protein